MCRVLGYLGQTILLDDLLYKPDSSLIRQTYNPRLMSHILNLAGFGMAVWEWNSYQPATPLLYKTATLPFYDNNLKRMALKLQANCLLAHIRGVSYSEDELVVEQNVHPFLFNPLMLTMAHNGELAAFREMKFELLNYIKPHFAKQIHGTTDSEWIYALLVSQFEDPITQPSVEDVVQAVLKSFAILKDLRAKHGIKITSPLNLFISNGQLLVATRYVFDYGCNLNEVNQAHLRYHSLWYTSGSEFVFMDGVYRMAHEEKKHSIVIASEPLTTDVESWHEVPEYALISASYKADGLKINIQKIEV